MVFIVRGVLAGRGTTYTAELETRKAAIRSANELREHGFEVTITDGDGRPVEETEGDIGD